MQKSENSLLTACFPIFFLFAAVKIKNPIDLAATESFIITIERGGAIC